jgi:tRNA-dihydrouridine synthase B
MIGRAAHGRPWIFRQMEHFLRTGSELAEPPLSQQRDWLLEHMRKLFEFYGEYLGVRVARKHIGWYVVRLPGEQEFRRLVNRIDDCRKQLRETRRYFESLVEHGLVAA